MIKSLIRCNYIIAAKVKENRDKSKYFPLFFIVEVRTETVKLENSVNSSYFILFFKQLFVTLHPLFRRNRWQEEELPSYVAREL